MQYTCGQTPRITLWSVGPLAAAGEVVTDGRTHTHTESQTIIMDVFNPGVNTYVLMNIHKHHKC